MVAAAPRVCPAASYVRTSSCSCRRRRSACRATAPAPPGLARGLGGALPRSRTALPCPPVGARHPDHRLADHASGAAWGRRAPGAGGSTVDAPGAGAGGAAGDRPGALGRHRAGRLCPVQRETGLNDAEAAAREDALFRLLVTADAYPHLRAAVDAGVFLAKVTRSGSGWPAAWTESLPTSSPPGVATTTNRTRGRGWMTPGSPKTAAPGRPRRPSPPPRRRCTTRADSSGSPPARPGRGCVARARVESTTGGCVHSLPNTGLGRQIWQPEGSSGRKWRQGPAVPRPAARPGPA